MNSDTKKRLLRTLVLSLVALFVGVGIGFYQISGEKSNVMRVKTSAPMAGSSIGGGFSLVNHDGALVSEADFDGDYKLIYFGFTYCPAICPTELQKMTQVLKQLGSDAAGVQPLFITIDPARDTASVMKDYVGLFHERFVGLTGSQAQVDKVLKGYRIYANKVQDETMSDYTMDHSSYIYLMNPKNQLMAIYHMEDGVDFIIKDIKKYL